MDASNGRTTVAGEQNEQNSEPLSGIEPDKHGLYQLSSTATVWLDEENGFDDGLSVMIEFAAPAVEPHTVGRQATAQAES